VDEAEDKYADGARYCARDDLLVLLDEWGVYPDRVLDIGCGTGLMGQRMLRRGARDVWGIEPQQRAFATANRRLSRVINSTFPCPGLAGEHFDLVVMADVLEHTVDPWGILRLVPPLLTDAGMVLISLPNVSHVNVIAQLARGRWTYSQEGLLDRTHLRFFTPSTTMDLIEGAGLHVVRRFDQRLEGRRRLRWPAALLRPVFPHLTTLHVVTLSRASTGTAASSSGVVQEGALAHEGACADAHVPPRGTAGTGVK